MSSDATAHPRVSGENEFDTEAIIDRAGSSPRERGKRSGKGHSLKNLGLIPA